MTKAIKKLVGWRSPWQRKQDAASPSRYYGDGGTIHSTGYLDVETFEGTPLTANAPRP